ncbi:P-loop ATPase, Sll1717 family [Fusobacterium sp.]|uniref:P-loop ATPase, Sll1717 family n=1 Tax=Fusobacterium sp. TaxID=68766 RepID=UPI002A828986|nr:hypothetical protein [Fusobacterium sp.]
MKKFGEYNFGRIDGKKEVDIFKEKNLKLEDMFYDYNDIFQQLNKKKFLIIGDKGSGKTLLIEYFKEKKKYMDSTFIDMNISDIFDKYLLLYTSTQNFKYYLKWEIAKELSNYLLKENIPINTIQERELNTIISKNPFDKEISQRPIFNFDNKVVNYILEIEKFKIGYIFGKIVSIFVKKNEENDYMRFLDSIFQKIFKVLENIKKREIYLIFDEIDDLLRKLKKEEWKEILEELIIVSSSFNTKLKKDGIDTRIIVSIREDMFQYLELPNSNKIKEDAVILDWGTSEDRDSPLFKIIFNKMRNQDSSLKKIKNETIFMSIFKEKEIQISLNNKISVEKYILGKTFLRPRDIIAFFISISHLMKDKKELTASDLRIISKDYSKHIFGEIKDRIVGYLNSEEYSEFLKLLKSYNRTRFKKEDLDIYLSKNKDGFKFINSKNLFKYIEEFFNVGLLGEFYKSDNNRVEERFKYKNNNIHISEENEFIIHYGIREYLGMSREIRIAEKKISDDLYRKILFLLGNFLDKPFRYRDLLNKEKIKNKILTEIPNSEFEEAIFYFYSIGVIKRIKKPKNNIIKISNKTVQRLSLDDYLYIYEEDFPKL